MSEERRSDGTDTVARIDPDVGAPTDVGLPTFDLLDLRVRAPAPTPFGSADAENDITAPTTFRLVAHDRLCTPFRFLYGGSGIAACAEAAERSTRRPVQWITAQYLGSPPPGAELDVDVTVDASGRSSSQTRVLVTDTATGDVVIAALAAHNVRPRGDEQAFGVAPDVPPPDEAEDFLEPFATDGHVSFFDQLERKMAAGRMRPDDIGPRSDGSLAMWVRLRDGGIGSAATQGFVADVGPLAACIRLGIPLGGTSLDNTIRVVDAEPTEWVLFDMHVDGFARSVAHTTVRLWSDDGRLLGLAQQSAIIRTSHHRR
ncbi:MAG: thioesterase family protein [Actinomycetota bacterium]